MNIDNIISELDNKGLISGVPNDSHVTRGETDSSINSIYPLSNHPETSEMNYPRNSKIDDVSPEERIFIGDGDLKDYPNTHNFGGRIEGPSGIDALAWYRTYHWHDPYKWGIYITDWGLYHIAQHYLLPLKQKNGLGQPYNMIDLLRQSFRLLYWHEYFHFVTDMACTVLELTSSPVFRFSEEYFYKIYKNPINSNEPLEEALANAYTYEKFWRKYPGTTKAIRKFMDHQPNGYSAYSDYLRSKFKPGVRELATIITRTHPQVNPIDSLEILFDYHRKFLKYCPVPIYIVKTLKADKYRIKFVHSQIPEKLLIKSKKFLKDVKKLSSEIIKKLDRAIGQLSINLNLNGLGFKPLKSCDSVFRFRLDRNFRVTLRPAGGKWELLRVGKHEYVDRNPI